MFGNYKRTLDNKNRVLIPSKLRKNLNYLIFITLGPDNVLEIRNKKNFLEWKNKLLSTNSLNKQARIFTRLLLGNTFELEIDKQGRINLPDNFIKKINIVKDVLFIGIGTKIELWPFEKYKIFEKKFENEDSLD